MEPKPDRERRADFRERTALATLGHYLSAMNQSIQIDVLVGRAMAVTEALTEAMYPKDSP